MSSASNTPKSSKRPRSIAELATAAQVYPWDPSKSLKEILITTSALKKSGDKYRDEGDLESAFIDYARAATIVLERIPQHVSYPDLSSVHRHNLSLNGNDILDRIGQLKPLLSDRYEKYATDKSATSTPAGATSSGASASNAAQRARAERAEAARHQAEENAAAQRRHEEDARRQADREAKRRAAEDESRRRAEAEAAQAQAQRRREEEEEATRWNLQQLESSLQASASAATREVQRHQQQQRAIAYIPPVVDDMYLPQPHPLTRPRDDDSASEFGGSSSLGHRTGLPQPHPGHPPPRGILDPITTTSAPPTEADSIQYPNLMSPHQRTQGYAPSLQSMFTSPAGGGGLPPPANGLGDTMLGLDVTGRIPQYPSYPQRTQPYAGPSAPSGPAFGYGSAPQPFVIRKTTSDYPHAPEPRPERPPKPFDVYSSAQHGRSGSQGGSGNSNVAPVQAFKSPPPVIKASELPADELPSGDLKPVLFPRDTLTKFVQIASYNTSKNLETCGLLLGRLKRNGKGYIVTTLVIPRQHATSETCTMDGEEILADYQLERDLLTLGWIHTHPTQSCFMSSVDLHTHASYQHMLPEAFAVVCAPKSRPNFGIFRLTDPPGLQTILACHQKSAFHPHPPDIPIYTDADKGHVLMQDLPLEIADLRDRQY